LLYEAEPFAGVMYNLGKIAAETNYELVMVSNQDGLGTDSLREEDFYPVHDFLMSLLESEGIRFKSP
jgi:imidazoleglycerol-phosphate dehydratase/histidinol-phosphatase